MEVLGVQVFPILRAETFRGLGALGSEFEGFIGLGRRVKGALAFAQEQGKLANKRYQGYMPRSQDNTRTWGF